MPELINIGVLRHPTNWLIVFVVLMIWVFLFDLLHAGFTGRDPADQASAA